MKYEYECPGDGNVVVIERSIKDPELEYDCPECGTTLKRIYSPPPVSFKGSGFYSTDK